MYNKKHIFQTENPSSSKPDYNALLSSAALGELFSLCADFERRDIYLGLTGKLKLSLMWLDGVVAGSTVAEDIIRPLTELSRMNDIASQSKAMELILHGAVYSYSAFAAETLHDASDRLTHGCAVLVFDELHRAVCFEVKSDKTRSIEQPTLEKSLKGAKDAFVETLRTNTALVRRRICSPELKLIELSVGRRSGTKAAVMYLEGVAAPGTVEELTARLAALDVDGLLSCGILEETIVDAPLSPFPQLLHTERPDRFAMYLLDGRVGLLVDGLPVGFVVPVTLSEFMKVTGDSSNHFTVVSFLTVLRWFALILSVTLPALYVAIAMYHQEMIPTKLLLSVIEAKRDVPFSTALEVLGMLTAFELLQEAGLRLPNPIGDTVSIIGALIVGQSAVEAKVVSPIAIIVVALSGIACYTLPSQDLGAAVRLTRLVYVLSAVLGGLFGVGIVSCLVILHLCSINSFGVNYTAPVTDARPFPLFRLLIQKPKALYKYRDPLLHTPDRRRQK